MPNWPAIISAVISENQQVPMPMLKPVTIDGNAPGKITSQKDLPVPGAQTLGRVQKAAVNPFDSVNRTQQDGIKRPNEADVNILCSAVANIRIDNGIQATAGIGRRISNGD